MEQQVSIGSDRPVKEDHLWKWTTLTTGRPTMYFVYFHTFSYKFEVQQTPQSLGSLCFDQKISTGKEAFLLFLNRNFRNFWHDGKNPRGRSETKGLETVIIGNDTAVTLMGGSTVVKSLCIANPCK